MLAVSYYRWMKKLTPKRPRRIKIEPEVKKKASKPVKTGLSKSDPDFYKKIGLLSVKRRKLSSEDYAAMASLSHPRPEYHGGRPKKTDDDE
jgi:hypothetical protein